MSIIVSVKVQDGVVLASDSCVLHRGHSYFNGEKTICPIKALPIGVMIAGDGAIGLTSIANHLRAYGQLTTARSGPWRLNKSLYTLGGVVSDMQRYLLDVAKLEDEEMRTTLTVVGYSAGRTLPETWRLVMDGSDGEPELIWGESEYGITWDGERECLDRLLCGTPGGLVSVASEFGLSEEQSVQLHGRLAEACGSDLVAPGMPLNDAVELARFLVDTTISFVAFSLSETQKTVGGPIDIASITRHEGYRWVQSKRASAIAGSR